MTMLEGLDVSAHNPAALVPWGSVGFGFVRISHGLGSDLSALEHLSRARDKALVCLGVYHWLKGNSPGRAQAEHFFARAQMLEAGHDRLALALDLEDPAKDESPWDRAQYAQTAINFLSRLRELDSRPSAIYGSPGYLETLSLPGALAGPLWAAHWGVAQPMVVKPWSDWTIHQYSNSGGKLDRNRFRGTCENFRALFTPPPLNGPSWDHLSPNLRAVAGAAGHRVGSVTDFVSVPEGPNIEPEGGKNGG